MNWHFIFFLLHIAGWMTVATLLCSCLFIKKSHKVNFDKSTKFCVVSVSLFTGLFSVLINGQPEIGFALDSFLFSFLGAIVIIFYQIIKAKRDYFPKIIRKSRRVSYA